MEGITVEAGDVLPVEFDRKPSAATGGGFETVDAGEDLGEASGNEGVERFGPSAGAGTGLDCG